MPAQSTIAADEVMLDQPSETAARAELRCWYGRPKLVGQLARRLVLAVLILGAWRVEPAGASVATFESGQVRPLVLSPDGRALFAVNTPDDRLEIFDVAAGGLTHRTSLPVGLEPVAVAARTDGEVWVVNHLSDSVSVIDVVSTPPRIVRTLLVGDEPRDIVFAGPRIDGRSTRAFITSARRGQNLPASIPANLTTPSTPRALVWVFDATNLGESMGGTPVTVVELFGDTPRALAATPDGDSVYAAVFQSGNQTTSVPEGAVCNGGAAAAPCTLDGIQIPGGTPDAKAPGGLPLPNVDANNVRGPETGLVVKLNRDNGQWQDQVGRNWTNAVRFNLPDLDVFKINALSNPPAESQAYPHVGTVLFNMLVNPANRKLYVTNTEARNEVRFEGPGKSSTTVRGHLQEARITVVDGDTVLPRHLNKHITALPQAYRTTPMPAGVKDNSLATPTDLVLASDGTLYVAAFGSSKIGKLNSTALEDDTFAPSAATHIEVSGGGPSGLALDEVNGRLYVLTRFDNAVKVIDTSTNSEIAQHPLYNPEPASVVQGRHFLYDARLTSSNGEASCSSCHVFGDFDSLAWDLGNPDDVVKPNPNPLGPIGSFDPFHPLKGPMTTQTLRGLAHDGPMHWRGDRTGGQVPGGDMGLDTNLAFKAFNVAFGSLLGRDEGQIPDGDMQAFTDFALQIVMPPNPVRSLDNVLNVAQANGRDIYFNRPESDRIVPCKGCHTLSARDGFFGTAGVTTFEGEAQQFKVPQLRNLYSKAGMFGMVDPTFTALPLSERQHQGDQVRGFGFMHDGSAARILDFLHVAVFQLSEADRNDLEQFVLAFDTTFAPIVGQQITLTSSNAVVVAPRLALMRSRAMTAFALVDSPGAKECELVVRGTVGGEARGYLLEAGSGQFRSDRAADALLSEAQLRGLANTAGQELTYTCGPPGSGVRLGLDRDGDGFFDRDELDAGSDPSNSADTPFGMPTPTPTPGPTATPTRVRNRCVGDCNADGEVTVDEIMIGVNIVLGSRMMAICPSFEQNDDGRITIDELVQGVSAILGLPGFLCSL
jgi:YVTN family beta-propeller protein